MNRRWEKTATVLWSVTTVDNRTTPWAINCSKPATLFATRTLAFLGRSGAFCTSGNRNKYFTVYLITWWRHKCFTKLRLQHCYQQLTLTACWSAFDRSGFLQLCVFVFWKSYWEVFLLVFSQKKSFTPRQVFDRILSICNSNKTWNFATCDVNHFMTSSSRLVSTL